MAVPEQLFYLLFQTAHQRDIRLAERLGRVGVTVARWRTLAVIRRLTECSMSDLSRLTGTDRTTLTRAVDQLVAAGVVDRSADANDRRRVILQLTPAGHNLYAQCVQAMMGLNSEVIEAIPLKMRRDVVRGLEALLVKLVVDPADSDSIRRFTRGEVV